MDPLPVELFDMIIRWATARLRDLAVCAVVCWDWRWHLIYDVRILEWINQNQDHLLSPLIYREAAEEIPTIRTMELLMSASPFRFPIWNSRTVSKLAKQGNVELVRWLIQRNPPTCDRFTVQCMMGSKNFETECIMEIIRDYRIPDRQVIEDALTHNREDILRLYDGVVISERFNRHDLRVSDIVRSGNMTLLDWSVKNKHLDPDNEHHMRLIFKEAIIHYNFEALQWVIDKGYTLKEMCYEPFFTDHLTILRWLVEEQGCSLCPSGHIAWMIGSSENLELIRWVYSQFDEDFWRENVSQVFEGATIDGRIDIIEWFLQKGHHMTEECKTHMMEFFPDCAAFETTKYLLEEKQFRWYSCPVTACDSSNLPTPALLDLIVKHDYPKNRSDLFAEATQFDNVEYLKNLVALGFDWRDKNALCCAARHGALKVLRWLRDPSQHTGGIICPWIYYDEYLYRDVMINGHIHVLEWLEEQNSHWLTTHAVDAKVKQLLVVAFKYDQFHVMEWVMQRVDVTCFHCVDEERSFILQKKGFDLILAEMGFCDLVEVD